MLHDFVSCSIFCVSCYMIWCFITGMSALLQDGVYLITMNPDIIRDYKKAILTPNVVEYARLFETIVSTSKVCFCAYVKVKQKS